jgi:hypothetical protein
MNKLIAWAISLSSITVLGTVGTIRGADAGTTPKAQLPFFVYADGGSKQNHFIASGFTGDYGAIRMAEKCAENPRSGDSCLKFSYSGQTPQKMKWAGVFFQNPANNWGTSNGGYDLTGARKLKFFARGDKGGEAVEFKLGGVNGAFTDSDSASTGPLTLTREWKQYEIPLDRLDLTFIFSGFAWIAEAEKNPEGFVIYLDEIVYE